MTPFSTPPMPPGQNFLQSFLHSSRAALVAASKSKYPSPAPVPISIGNESADIDSFASSILYAYLTPTRPRPIPILSIPRADLALRPEFLYILRKLRLQPTDVIFSDDEPAFQTLPAPLQLHLVDHNSSHSLPHPVASIIDHHADEGQHLSASPRIITPSGSCSSLIINELFNPAQLAEEERVQIATLALAAVLIDTAGMSHKVTAHDEAAVEMLEACCEVGYERAGFFGALFAAKTDVEGMETRDLLRKDWKEWEEGGLRVGVASVVKGLGWLDGRGDLLDTVKSWGTERKCDVVAVMTTDGKGEGFKRELLLWALKEEGRNCVKCFWEQAGDEGMKLESLGGGELDGEHRKAWTQGNLAMSRKQVAPLLRECLKKSFDTKL